MKRSSNNNIHMDNLKIKIKTINHIDTNIDEFMRDFIK